MGLVAPSRRSTQMYGVPFPCERHWLTSTCNHQSDERDSAYSDHQTSYTMSVTSSVFNFRYENGRRYHAYAEGMYPVPNDEVEADRLELQHHAFRLTLDGKLHRAPIPQDIHNVLDIGCGTGIWSIEFADEHPSARVLGTDLSPIQPCSVPPNCEFLIDDFELDWIFHEEFDFIHTRALVAAVKDWNRFFSQAFTNLKPGGYLECQELTFPIKCMDPSVTDENSPLMKWSALFVEAAGKLGIDGTGPRHLGPKLRSAGFVDINAKTCKWPVGRWAKGDKFKLLGDLAYADLMDWLPSSSLGLFTRVLKWTQHEVEVFLAECRAEAKRKDRHYYADVLFWYARKPRNTTSVYSHEPVHDEEELELDDQNQTT
ncbi:S-adenosyl-L-methionine-dependent methyltransferase [Dothidotthia symphoricarpi CBS 119687]|uniref:S-adenosyl-L-methionine-dependent methyltransferase n=1 Tax=Dothidotthia symphoricarpi CBS 119687 TaxID=1392245 RepID=A0A6A6A8Q4_9PLEO|nr:S-adenosyl-L-methionine-dependent methyltransferase [Dothidotthia symphoricarpi CBS 119687]KAF2127454.1 S-adenosyl-L-methionine-dependent methyltransferase [Dothidotthia symphoricarpi CBS 119687]